mmetsp:Transcript_63534/g.197142  ORF Transcript_63534/g.197142 Transcript_63534/m.197142 type:complete len:226 (-) Transcript_63534:683-1360(-)
MGGNAGSCGCSTGCSGLTCGGGSFGGGGSGATSPRRARQFTTSASKARPQRCSTTRRVSRPKVCWGQKKPGLCSPSQERRASARAVGPSKAIQPDSGSASARSGKTACSRTRRSSNFTGSFTARLAMRLVTSELYFFRREESQSSITGPWPSTVKKRRWSSLPMPSRSSSTAHIQRKRVRRPCKARATATRKDSFLEASFTTVKNFTKGCSIFMSVSASAMGVAG